MADLAIRGGRVVLHDAVREVDVLILAGSIIRIVAPGEGDAAETIDARGLLVLPGVVDAHVHVNEPGRTEWEGWVAATRGAARGGVTTVADMPLNSIPPTLDEAAFDVKEAAASADGIAAVARARRAGLDITAETCPHYLAYDASDLDLGSLIKCAPPIRAGARARLWEDVLAGHVDHIASDHSPCTAELKTRGNDDVFVAWGGISGIQSTLPLLLSEGMNARGLPAELLAQLLATRPAKRLGIWPRKGEIRVGTDADFALVDPDRAWTLERDALETRSGLSPYAGRRFRGAVVRTIVRGRTVYADGEVN